jgi:hypothetical protein
MPGNRPVGFLLPAEIGERMPLPKHLTGIVIIAIVSRHIPYVLVDMSVHRVVGRER